MRERVVVYGGSGYIGSALVEKLLDDGYEVRVADVERPPRKSSRAEYIKCDVRDYEEVVKALEGCDAAVSMAIIQIPRINEERKLGYEVNVIGTQNVCEAVYRSGLTRGLIVAGSWHVIGEYGITGIVDESYGYRPDKLEERGRVYALSKVAQETITRLYASMSYEKSYCVIRTGTVLGEGMPTATAARTFIENALAGKEITPYRHSMYRPMLYVDLDDVIAGYAFLLRKVLDGELLRLKWWDLIFNLFYPEPMTILELAELVRDVVREETGGRVRPAINIVDLGVKQQFSANDKESFKIDISRSQSYLGLRALTHPREAIRKIVRASLTSGCKYFQNNSTPG